MILKSILNIHSMDYVIQTNDKSVYIDIQGKLTYVDHHRFTEMFKQLDQRASYYILKLENLEFIDSAGLGMLIFMRDKASEKNITVILKGSCGQVKKMFELSQFNQLFVIET